MLEVASPIDRRKFKRVATDQVISFAPMGQRDQLGVGRDVSAGGIRFEVIGCDVQLGEMLRIAFNLVDETIVATGHVVWATEIDPLTLDVGIEFVEIEDSALRILDEIVTAEF